MKTSEQVEEEFKSDLRDFLKKWGADIEASDHFTGYSECGEDIRVTVTLSGIYTTEGECIREYAEIDLGGSFS